MSDDLEEAARRRADAVRRKRRERADPDDRVGRVRAQADPPEEFDLPEPDGDVDLSLPPGLREEAETVRKKLSHGFDEEFDVELDAETHYWPLVVHLGVERLKGMWLAEVRRTMEDDDDLAAPDER